MSNHLIYQERLYIERSLNNLKSFNQIALDLGKSRSTISREVKKRCTFHDKGAFGRIKNRCIHAHDCNVLYLCDEIDCIKKCSTCKLCNSKCSMFEENICKKLFSSPYVCNGCNDRQKCVLKKKIYSAKVAQKSYESLLTESRCGFNLTDEELLYIDSVCSPLIKNGQSVYHIFNSNQSDMLCSKRSIYRLVDACALSCINLDMPRKCTMKKRKSTQRTIKVERDCRIGRTYKDFIEFMKQNPDIGHSQMDSVIGSVGGKVLLTIIFEPIGFMLAFIRQRNTAKSVEEIFLVLKSFLPEKVYKVLFQVILTDNGAEFSNPSSIEYISSSDEKISNIFYCDPNSPFQKAQVEVNHEFIRRIIPKGASMDGYTQDDIDLMMSHINSYAREKYAGKSPTELFVDMFGEDMLHLLRQQKIPKEKIILKPSLLKK